MNNTVRFSDVSSDLCQGGHAGNLRALVQVYTNHNARQLKRIKWYGGYDANSPSGRNDIEHTHDGLKAYADIATRYACIFDLPLPVFDVDGDARRIENRRLRLKNSPEAKKREAQRAVVAERQRIAQIERDRIVRRESAEIVELWKAGDRNARIPYGAVRGADDSAYLRIIVRQGALSTDREILETSLGAEVPLNQARRAYAFGLTVRSAQSTLVSGGWERDRTLTGQYETKVGHFSIDKITALGVNIGCHFVSWSELDRVLGPQTAPQPDSACTARADDDGMALA